MYLARPPPLPFPPCLPPLSPVPSLPPSSLFPFPPCLSPLSPSLLPSLLHLHTHYTLFFLSPSLSPSPHLRSKTEGTPSKHMSHSTSVHSSTSKHSSHPHSSSSHSHSSHSHTTSLYSHSHSSKDSSHRSHSSSHHHTSHSSHHASYSSHHHDRVKEKDRGHSRYILHSILGECSAFLAVE